MATIVTRAGKGSPLTNAEVDANFVNLNNDKLEVATAASTYAPLTGTGASGTWNISITGNAATVTNGVVTTGSYADPAWITSLAETKVLPSQTGNSGKFLTTNGSSTSWGTVDLTPYLTTATAASTYVSLTGSYADPSWVTSLSETKVLPSQTSNSGKFLTTNGTNTSWGTVDLSPYLTTTTAAATYAPLGGAGTSGTWGISITGNAATVTNGVYTTGNQTVSGQKTFDGGMLSITGVIGLYTGQLLIGSRNLRNVTSTNSWEMVNAANTAVIYTFDNSGNLTAAGNVTAYSDERVKTNWRPVADNFVELLASVKSGVYDRTDMKATQAGVSAQSLQRVLAETVLINENGDLSVAYGNAALVSAIELAKDVVRLKARLEALEAK